ncbi:hypothetical protein HRR81_001906 [Exophiala dermatitidis]|uniref:Uncharacterized protein n=1 Tax=Exophiala dermatitidis TaxID=5970 RepID=A0AAN6EY54_EXODE|nr:hypothetical protein HRR74_003057 [Exophiala dermatitidis]KAJ4529796.1 hypothetical protein HRR73_000824 [Exophiala dermatitidis]KAJ4543037.1 hypothetical protein HRR77_005298 [Exophiala dermatitidis]KAJ4583171.1 hypothetical protein HRR81_001906 [Exophiala dermatitidis]KAJ4587936.1 hypothetical protein HRR82_001726 [Exophiala dermatitidis]
MAGRYGVTMNVKLYEAYHNGGAFSSSLWYRGTVIHQCLSTKYGCATAAISLREEPTMRHGWLYMTGDRSRSSGARKLYLPRLQSATSSFVFVRALSRPHPELWASSTFLGCSSVSTLAHG